MNILVPLAEGFEEIEAVVTIDVLRRAGLDVITAGLPGTMVRGAHGVAVTADKKLSDINPDDFDALVLVGGNPGYKNLGNSQTVLDSIKRFDSSNKLIAAICASPTVLARAGILDNRKATVYPGMEREIPIPRGERLVVDSNVITSQGPGTAIEFALKVVETLLGGDAVERLKRELVV